MRYFILTLLFSFIFSECDDLNVLQCSSNADCEWIEDIDYGSCGSLGAGECNSTPGCNWECGFSHGSCYWCCWYECGGGSYEIDNSYCQENPNPPSCSEMGQSQCNNSDCEWVENIETDNCYDILDCTDGCTWQDCEAIEGCNWHFGTAYYDPSYCYGEHEVDNSYCEEIVIPECSEMSETECSSDDVCEWIEDIEIGNCSVFDNSESSCTSYSGECYWDEDITYSSCNGYDNSQWACNNAQGCYWDCSDYGWYCGCNGQEITGVDTECIGQYEIDNSYCESIPYELGDVNQDSIINIQDIIIIINLILNGEFDLVADINLDSTVNVLDIIQIVNVILN